MQFGELPFLTTASILSLGPSQQPIQWSLGAIYLADHSPPSSPEVKNAWSFMLFCTFLTHFIIL